VFTLLKTCISVKSPSTVAYCSSSYSKTKIDIILKSATSMYSWKAFNRSKTTISVKHLITVAYCSSSYSKTKMDIIFAISNIDILLNCVYIIKNKCFRKKHLITVVKTTVRTSIFCWKLGISHGAKLIKLADKLYNLRVILRTTPVGWSRHDVASYFEFATRVVDQIRGTSPELESALDAVFAKYAASKKWFFNRRVYLPLWSLPWCFILYISLE